MEDEILKIESSQRQRFNDIQHQEKMNLIIEQEEYNLFAILKPKFYKDEDDGEWVVLLGENLKKGIYGSGDTLYKAILNFNKSFHKIK